MKCAIRMLLVSAAILAVISGGCAWRLTHPFGPAQVSVAENMAIENPLFVPIPDSEFVWNQLVDEIDNYFRIDREQRVHEVGGILTEGRIDTFPMIGSTLFEPWRRDSTPGYEKWHSTFQSLRRTATVRVIPRQGGFLVEVHVLKELEDLNAPEHATVGGSTLRYDGSLVRNDANPSRKPTGPLRGSTTLGWITLGRDQSLEQQILAELRGRLSNVQPPKHPPHAFAPSLRTP